MTETADAAPLTPEEVEPLFAPLAGRHLLVGWSGGPDSTALAGCLAHWAKSHNATVATATVDHGLRDGSRKEAEWVARRAEERGLTHRILSWEGDKPATGLQQAAREARYALLAAEARRIGADTLVTAHTLDDQAETILMRLARGSGLDGLRGMQPVTSRDGLGLARPFLPISKARLIATCDARRWDYLRDPSNSDPRFTRARLRRLMPLLAEEGLTPERLALFARRAGEAIDTIDWQARHWQRIEHRNDPARPTQIDLTVYAGAPVTMLVRLLLHLVPPADGKPGRLERYERTATRLHEALKLHKPMQTTLAGQLLRLTRGADLLITPEPERRRGRKPAQDDQA